MSLLFAASQALKTNNVKHGSLSFSPNGGYNEAIEDGKNVFCKVAPVNGSITNLTSITKELEFTRIYGNCLSAPIPAHEAIIEFAYDGVQRTMAVWRWEHINTIKPEIATGIFVSQAMSDLQKIHQLPILETLPVLGLGSLLESVEHRVKIAAQFSPSARHLAILKNLVDKFYDERDINFSNPVLIHGDCHIGNYAISPLGNKWIDYESVRVAPREWDYAGMYINLSITSNNKKAWVEASKDLEAYDEEKFFQACAIKCISTASSLLLRESSHSKFEQRMEALESLLHTKNIPTMF